jgi:hypothetical protein
MNDNLRARDVVVALCVGLLICVALFASTIFGWVAFGTVR